VVPKYPGAEKRALSSHCPSFLTHPRSKPASLAETASLEGVEGTVEGSVFVRLFKVADWLLADQTKKDKPTKSTMAKSTFLSTALSSFLDEILNQEPREKGNCSKTTNPSSIQEIH
jgi:hypothetical protein